MNRNFRKWLACAVAVTIAVYNAPYSVEALEVIKDSVQVDSNNSSEEEGAKPKDEQNSDVPQAEGDVAQPEDDGVQSEDGTQAEERNSENTTEQNNTDGLTQVGAFWVNGKQVEGNKGDWTFSNNGELTISKDAIKNIRIEGNGQQTTDRVVIQAGYQGTVTIKNLNIDSKDDWSRAFEFQTTDDSTTKVELILEGTNTLKSGKGNPGLKFNGKGNGSLLTIKGNGKLTAIGGKFGSGIGGGDTENGQNITISGGTVTATGGEHGSGIGGGYIRNGQNITISGGTVTATGGKYGSGIGGGNNLNGNRNGNGQNIIISGGTVTATGGEHGSGIGGGYIGNGQNITISGGTVTAKGGTSGAGIGGGYDGSGSNITIAGGSVNTNSISITPDDGNGKSVYLVKLDEQEGFTEGNIVKVSAKNLSEESISDKDYKVVSNHPNNDSFYLYMPIGTYTITTHKGVYRVNVTNKESFVTETPNPEDMVMTNTKEGLLVDVSNYPSKYGDVMCKLNDTGWTDEKIINDKRQILFKNIDSKNGNQTIYIKYKGNDSYLESESSNKTFTIGNITLKESIVYTGNAITENEVVESKSGNGKVTLEYSKKDEDSWNTTPPTDVGIYKVKATLEATDEYTGAIVEGEFKIIKADSEVKITTTSLNKEYDGKVVNNPNYTTSINDGKVTIKWQKNTGTENEPVWVDLKEGAPKEAGSYQVVVKLAGNDNYNPASATLGFVIYRATSSIEFKNGTNFNKIYDGKAVEVTEEHIEKTGSIGGVSFTFEKKVNDKWETITEAPSEAGTYQVKASLVEDNNYTSAESKYLYFTIYKAPEVTEENKNENVNTSTDRIEINIGTTEGNKGVYLYCTESTEVPTLPKISSKFRKVDEWEKANGSKHVFTGLKPNTTYHVWKYDNAKPEGEKLTYEYSIKTDSPSTPSIPSKPEEKPEEKPGIGVEVDVVDKIAGENRYDTSVSISQKVFPSKSDKVYLVSGEKFPDALSSAALTGKGDGPILLINDKNIDKILSEIDRLDAKEIVFIGGNSISDANEAKIRKFAKENSSVVKSIVGKDRYETAVKVAEQTISKYGNKGKVIIADGRNYPDAVSIASYAAKEGIPVILVNGNKVPDVVKSFLNKYKISNAIIVGGDKAVGKDVEKLFKSVDRVVGDDRYDTSKKIAEKFFAESKTVFVASGESFADSLSVSYYAGVKNAPILLTKANSLDNDTKEYLEKNKDKDYIIVGGDKAINPDLFK